MTIPSAETAIEIPKDNGVIEIRRVTESNGTLDITLRPISSGIYIPRQTCRTTLPVELLQYWAARCDFAWFCDAVARHDDPMTVSRATRRQLFAYFAPSHFAGKRLLDFGCGTGASTLAIARLLPETEVVGVELDDQRIAVANRIRSFRGVPNVRFEGSPAGDQLPAGIGDFDFVMLSAVYEHLLPSERKTVMPLLWSVMKPGGVLFLDQTPYRYAPLEAHSTGLWFINYLPDRFAHWTVRHFAGRNLNINRSKDWSVHLRGGLRGGTEKAVMGDLTQGEMRAVRILQPKQNGLRDRADFWLSRTNPNRHRKLKETIAAIFRFTDRTWGTVPALNLEVAIQKVPDQEASHSS